jgi:hypothetical protein
VFVERSMFRTKVVEKFEHTILCPVNLSLSLAVLGVTGQKGETAQELLCHAII